MANFSLYIEQAGEYGNVVAVELITSASFFTPF
jgi:hypothetical protein